MQTALTRDAKTSRVPVLDPTPHDHSQSGTGQTSSQSIVIIPTYNESETIVPLVERILETTPETDVLIVDDASPDGTGELATEMAEADHRVKVIRRVGERGFASAYRDGFRHALDRGYRLITQMDADFSHRPEDLPKLISRARTADVVIGSRNVDGGRTENWPLLRKVVSRGGSVYTRTMLRLPVRDCTSGYKCIRRRALASIDLSEVSSAGFAFQVETNYRFHRAGMRMVEVPIIFPDRIAGESKMSKGIFVEAITLVLRLRWNDRPRLRVNEQVSGLVHRTRRALGGHVRYLVRFAAVGGSGVLVNSALLVLFVEAVGLAPLISAGLAAEAAILSNFVLNDAWTFRDVARRSSRLASAVRYNVNALGGLAISLATLAVLTHGAGLNYFVANLVAIVAAMLWNYASNVRWTWTTPHRERWQVEWEADNG